MHVQPCVCPAPGYYGLATSETAASEDTPCGPVSPSVRGVGRQEVYEAFPALPLGLWGPTKKPALKVGWPRDSESWQRAAQTTFLELFIRDSMRVVFCFSAIFLGPQSLCSWRKVSWCQPTWDRHSGRLDLKILICHSGMKAVSAPGPPLEPCWEVCEISHLLSETTGSLSSCYRSS